MIATIKPRRIELYVNSGKKTLAQIKAETGASHIINGGLYDLKTRVPYCQLKAGGKVYTTDTDNYWGFAWDDVSDFGMCRVPCSKANYIACVDLLRGGNNGDMIVTKDIDGSRQRTAIGRKADGSIVLYCTQSGRWPAEVREEMRNAGCVDAIMLDGGLSSQCDFDGWVLYADRKCHNYICVWAETAENGGDTTVATLKKGSQGTAVRNLQNQLITCGAKITADGDFGNLTDSAVKNFQKDMGLTADGIVGKQTFAALDAACLWKTSGNALVLKAGQYLGLAEPDGDNAIIDAFADISGTHYGYTASWCQMSVVVWMAEAKYDPFITASCTLAYNHYQSIGAILSAPAVGALIYFDWDKSGDADHVGVVSAIVDGYVYVIEGNSAGFGYDAVRIKRYLLTDTRIRGYADPTKKEESQPIYYIVKLTRAGAERLAREYGGEVVKYNG